MSPRGRPTDFQNVILMKDSGTCDGRLQMVLACLQVGVVAHEVAGLGPELLVGEALKIVLPLLLLQIWEVLFQA